MTTLLSYDDLVERGIVRNRTTLYRWIKDGKFPCGFMLSDNARRWTEDEVEEFVEAKRLAV